LSSTPVAAATFDAASTSDNAGGSKHLYLWFWMILIPLAVGLVIYSVASYFALKKSRKK